MNNMGELLALLNGEIEICEDAVRLKALAERLRQFANDCDWKSSQLPVQSSTSG